MSKREELAPFNNERLYVEGVLVDINAPNHKTHNQAGLVFASVLLPNEKIELDHVVISVPPSFIQKHNIELYGKYGFTAEVGSYYKRKYIMGIPAKTKAYHLQKINEYRFKTLEPQQPEDISRHLKNRLASLHRRNCPINIVELNYLLREMKEGERERTLQNITKAMTKKSVTHADIMNEIY